MRIIYDITIRSNRTDYKIKERSCSGTRKSSDKNETVFELEQTRRWFDRDHFEILPGFKVRLEEDPHEYVVTSITYTDKRPFRTILKTVRT